MTLLPRGTEFTGHNAHSPPTHLGLHPNGVYYMFDSHATQVLSHPYNAAQAHESSSSPLSTENGQVAYTVSDLAQQHHPRYPPTAASLGPSAPLLASAGLISPPTVAAPPASRNSPPYRCERCKAEFSGRRELERHLSSTKVHRGEQTRYYQCGCGTSKKARGDNHRRHVLSCKKRIMTPYVCKCGRECDDKIAHLKHFRTCSRIRGTQPTAS
ncbi:hypothetical protein F5Y14DRAFT_78507 [Nemania sp. NC0429]|nr:hypothetical protein F5Y14DRAFT_78507 [Nemania sp. NC0429]